MASKSASFERPFLIVRHKHANDVNFVMKAPQSLSPFPPSPMVEILQRLQSGVAGARHRSQGLGNFFYVDKLYLISSICRFSGDKKGQVHENFPERTVRLASTDSTGAASFTGRREDS